MIFRLRGVTYAYRARNGQTRANRLSAGRGVGEAAGVARPVLNDVSLDIPSGSTAAVLGLSGAGKSTLLYLLGLLWDGELAAGSIRYTDRDGASTHTPA